MFEKRGERLGELECRSVKTLDAVENSHKLSRGFQLAAKGMENIFHFCYKNYYFPATKEKKRKDDIV